MKYILFVGHYRSPLYRHMKQLESDEVSIIRIDPEHGGNIRGMHFDGVIFEEWVNTDYYLSRVKKK